MSSVALLLGLLVVAYVGSQLIGGRGESLRLASGAEYLVLGVALGPYALGAAERSTLHSFQPLAVIGTAWLTLVIGVGFGFREGRRVSFRGMLTGIVLAAFSGSAAAAAAYIVLDEVWHVAGDALVLVAGGVGLIACETTRHAVRWVVGRHGADGPLSTLIAEVSECDDLVPIAGMSVLFPLVDPPDVALHIPVWGWLAITPILGVLLGGTAAALLRAEPRASDGWGVILGAALLGTGIASRLGLAPQAVTFAIGVSLSLLSRHRSELRAMLGRSEQAVLLPVLMLSGAETEVRNLGPLLMLLAAVIVARLLIRLLAAPVLAGMSGTPRQISPALAVGLLPSGALSVTLGLAFESRYPGVSGDAVLAIAVGLAVAGELVGPASLRRALTRAGEITPRAALDAPPTPHAVQEATPR
ncbi:MAG TPA: potassium transporter Kef [Polyangiaceae bacterium]|jgi:Kef-type K+ transport system membrane component KefB|nr:potassium transporter Kef [Polyangiaceae bacterium]